LKSAIENTRAFLVSQWFTGAILALFVAAWLAPSVAQRVNPSGHTSTIAVILIFLITGITLKTEEGLRAMAAARAHTFIQLFNFGLFPLVVAGGVWCGRAWIPDGLAIGFMLLAVVPTTVTSCVVLTQLAGGNTAVALVNAMLNNIMGVFISPILLALMLGAAANDVSIDAAAAILKLTAIALAPLLAGQVIHWMVPKLVVRIRPIGSLINRWCMLTIIYLAFGKLFMDESAVQALRGGVGPLIMVIPLHLMMVLFADRGAWLIGLDRPQRIAAAFCAPQKTVALGLPMATVLFADRPDLLGVASLPLIAYHSMQLITGGLLEQRYRRPRPDVTING